MGQRPQFLGSEALPKVLGRAHKLKLKEILIFRDSERLGRSVLMKYESFRTPQTETLVQQTH